MELLKTSFIVILALILVASPIDGRKDLKKYWGDTMKGQAMPEALKEFINQKSSEGNKMGEVIEVFYKDFDSRPSTTEYVNPKVFNKAFDPIPNVSVYHDDGLLKEVKYPKTAKHEDQLEASNKLFAETFEPIPNVSVYNE